MGIGSSSFAFTQYQVISDPDVLREGSEEALIDILRTNCFESIAELPQEAEVFGWVKTLGAALGATVSEIYDCQIGPWFLFSLRRDSRTVPAKNLAEGIAKELSEWRARNPGRKKPSTTENAEMKLRVTQRLLPKVLPKQQTWDIAWNIDGKRMLIFTTNQKHLDLVEDMLYTDFEGMVLRPEVPIMTAQKLNPHCWEANKAQTMEVLDLLDANTWLGREALLWLIFRNAHGSCDFCGGLGALPVSIDGAPGFNLFYHDHCAMSHKSCVEESRKATLVGPVAEDFEDVRVGVHSGLNIDEVRLCLEVEEHAYSFKINTVTFCLSSVQLPTLILDGADKHTHPDEAFEAIIMHKLDHIDRLQRFLKLALATYLATRFSAGQWGAWEARIGGWLNKG